MSIYRRKPMVPYFSMAKCGGFREPPKITPPSDIINKVMSEEGELIDFHKKSSNDPVKKPEKKQKKKNLPGEKLLKKLTGTKAKDDKIARIKNAIRKDIEHLYVCNCENTKGTCSSCKAREKLSRG